MARANVSQQQLTVWAGVLTLLAWKRLPGVVAASVKVQTLLLDAEEKNSGDGQAQAWPGHVTWDGVRVRERESHLL